MWYQLRRRRENGESGAALVEFVLVIPLLLLFLFGIAELGIAMRDWLTMTSATRSGARVGSAAGTDAQADLLILQAVSAAMGTSDLDDVLSVQVFSADDNGDPIPGLVNSYTNVGTACGWSPCPDMANGGSYGGSWTPSVRNVTVSPATPLDKLGVRVNFDKQWLTPYFGGVVGNITAPWVDDAVMRMEPQQFGP